MIAVYDIDSISYDQFKKDHILSNKPCLIRRFINDKTCSHNNFMENIQDKKYNEYSIGNVTAYEGHYTKLCNNQLVKGIEQDSDLELNDVFRLWTHNKGNFTGWHYDGNGVDLFNVSLQGSKDFYLAPPNSLPVWPLCNLALPYPFKEVYKVRLLPGEMLYLPAYWFHKVITLEDNTININYIFFNKYLSELPGPQERNKDLYTLHTVFNSTMCEQPVCRIMNSPERVPYALIRGMLETLPVFIIYLIVLWCMPTKKWQVVWQSLIVVILVTGIWLPYIQSIAFGFTRLLGAFLGAWILLYHSVAGV